MRRNIILGLILLGIAGFARLVAAQDDPVKPAEDPFDAAAKTEPRVKRSADHIIKLAQPLGSEATLEERLEAKGTFQAEEIPLKDLVEALGTALDTSVVLAVKKLEEAAINTDTPVVYKLKNVKVQTALRLILGELGLAYVTQDDVILITTPEDAASRPTTRVYDCRELLKLPSPIQKAPYPNNATIEKAPETLPLKPVPEAAREDGGYDMEHLMNLITTIVEPESWDSVGGPNSIDEFKGLLTLSASQNIHEKVEQLLNLLHTASGLKEKVKVSR